MIWQTPQWGKMLLSTKQAESVFTVGWMQIEKRSVWLGQFGLFIIWLDYETPWFQDNIEELGQYLVEECKKEKALFIQIELLNYSGNLKNVFFDLTCFEFGHFKQFIYPYTALIDLTQTEEEILAWMKQKWRYNIKLATKRGVEVKEVEKTKENICLFYELMQETTARDKFFWHSCEYYEKFLAFLENSFLLLAFKNWKAIAGWIFILDDKVSLYYYWASTSNKEDIRDMPTFLIQWEAMKKAKAYGSHLYDFLWVAPEWYKNHPLDWVSNFKWKFTSDIRQVSEEYIYVNKKITYKIIQILRVSKSCFKKWKEKITNLVIQIKKKFHTTSNELKNN